MIGERRKTHLKNLEKADRERATTHKEELEVLRHENAELRQELHRFYGSECSSPGQSYTALQSHTTTSPLLTAEHLTAAAPAFAVGSSPLYTNPALPQQSHSFSPVDVDSSSSPSSMLCVLAPFSIPRVRSYLCTLFQSVLHPDAENMLYGSSQAHLIALASLAPSLPPQLQPTTLQLQTPHNIYIDLIPDPELREVLIRADVATANTFLADVCTFACNIEDKGQVVIWGDDFLNPLSWEFSPTVLERWGWLLPAAWEQRAIFWRGQRGDSTLPCWC